MKRARGSKLVSGRPTSSQYGMTILELVIALLVSVTALLLASQILIFASRQAALEQRVAVEMPASLAFRTLRADVVAAAGVGGTWSTDDEMILSYPDGRQVRYTLDDEEGQLLRKATLDGEETERPILGGVSEFSWAVSGGDKLGLEISLDYEVARHSAPLAEDGFRVVAPTVERRDSVFFALRGSGGNDGW